MMNNPELEPNFESDNKRSQNPEEIMTPEERIEKGRKDLLFIEERLQSAEEAIQKAMEELEKLKEDTDNSDVEDPDYGNEIKEEKEKTQKILARLLEAQSALVVQRGIFKELIAKWEERKHVLETPLLDIGPNRNN